MPPWIPTHIAALRRGEAGAGYTGRIGPDLLALAAAHRAAAERLRVVAGRAA